MTIVHAFKRTKPYTHVFPDVTLKFLPNDKGDVVCDVEDPSAVARLLATPTGFRDYDLPDGSDAKYILMSGDNRFDLRLLDDEMLHAFAKANDVKVHSAARGDTIRDKIVEALTKRG